MHESEDEEERIEELPKFEMESMLLEESQMLTPKSNNCSRGMMRAWNVKGSFRKFHGKQEHILCQCPMLKLFVS